jgi:predicted transposase/invertase (TIGR01784 family)
MQLDDKQRAAYSAYQEDLHYQASMFDSSYGDGYGEGKKVGIEEGKKDGIEEGATQKALQTARKMLSKGYEIKEIVDLTGLELEQIETLSKANQS